MFEISDSFAMIFLGLFGALLGSFANVVILRVPNGESIVLPGSHCPSCKTSLRWFDNIPILSFFILRGKCRSCSTNISWRYPLVEVLTAVLFILCFWKIGWKWFLIEALIFVLGLVIVSFIDFDHFLLPDVFTLPGILIGIIGAFINPERIWWDSLIGVIFGGGFLWAVAYFYFLIRKEDGLGGGDIKLMAWIGAVLGWNSFAFVIIVASVLGSLVGLSMAFRGDKGMKTVIPFGPYLALGAVLYLLGGETIAQWHMEMFLPGL